MLHFNVECTVLLDRIDRVCYVTRGDLSTSKPLNRGLAMRTLVLLFALASIVSSVFAEETASNTEICSGIHGGVYTPCTITHTEVIGDSVDISGVLVKLKGSGVTRDHFKSAMDGENVVLEWNESVSLVPPRKTVKVAVLAFENGAFTVELESRPAVFDTKTTILVVLTLFLMVCFVLF